MLTAESIRMATPGPWRLWGPYLSDRQWGTVREDYSANGDAWRYLPFDHARSRAYRWGEDGLLGISDDQQRLCLSLALWNGRDPILKERLFGLANEEGNHGEAVKELYYHLDATPSQSYLKALYKYPHRSFPYAKLYDENRRRGRAEPEYGLLDTGVFADDRYFDVFVEYAKASPTDLAMRVTIHNRGPDAAELHVLPTVWFRNTWSWIADDSMPELRFSGGRVIATHPTLGTYTIAADGSPEWIFCENETNAQRLFNAPGPQYPKDAFHEYVCQESPRGGEPGPHGNESRRLLPTHDSSRRLEVCHFETRQVQCRDSRRCLRHAHSRGGRVFTPTCNMPCKTPINGSCNGRPLPASSGTSSSIRSTSNAGSPVTQHSRRRRPRASQSAIPTGNI